jgi:hypothetical protein
VHAQDSEDEVLHVSVVTKRTEKSWDVQLSSGSQAMPGNASVYPDSSPIAIADDFGDLFASTDSNIAREMVSEEIENSEPFEVTIIPKGKRDNSTKETEMKAPPLATIPSAPTKPIATITSPIKPNVTAGLGAGGIVRENIFLVNDSELLEELEERDDETKVPNRKKRLKKKGDRNSDAFVQRLKDKVCFCIVYVFWTMILTNVEAQERDTGQPLLRRIL